MKKKGQYQTSQRKELQNYLQTIEGKHITVADICEHFNAQGKTIGTSTVYRQLERMVDDGIVDKYIVDSTSPACFVYVGDHDSMHEHRCYHCKCEKCGELIHIKCDEMKNIEAHLLKEHNFIFDSLRTVFYGVCENCRDKLSL